jgi:hypothetical protein
VGAGTDAAVQPYFLIGQAKDASIRSSLFSKKNVRPCVRRCSVVAYVCDSLECKNSALVAGHTCIFSYGSTVLIEMRDDASDCGTRCLAILQSASGALL